jgi:DNA-binding transcriptional MerR regulator
VTATAHRLRIGEVAELTGLTARTIRYYEEIGLLPASADREQGKHRLYSEDEVERIKEIVRLKELLGLTLEQLSQLLDAESARAELRREWHATEDPGEQRRILTEALRHLGTQLDLVRQRRAEIVRLEAELDERREFLHERLAKLES